MLALDPDDLDQVVATTAEIEVALTQLQQQSLEVEAKAAQIKQSQVGH
jgi:uncharacterized protein YfcZ (UPF0381/DUF406 family)